MSAFKHSAVSFGTLDMPPPDVGSTKGPISLHNALDPAFLRSHLKARSSQRVALCALRTDILARVLAKRPLDRAAKSFPVQDIRAESLGERVPVQIDGEVWGHLPMSFRIEPMAIRVIR